jgi:DNA-binding response OmpR family regulator
LSAFEDRPGAPGLDTSSIEAAAHILVVEDDAAISAMVTSFLQIEGYSVDAVSNGRALDVRLARSRVDLILLDIMLPEESGLDICKRIRAAGDTRIIIVTALAEVADRVAGLDLGADDYIGKPFELVELAARVRAVLRRIAPRGAGTHDMLQFAGWRFEPARRLLYTPKGVRTALTGSETDMMLTFYQHPGQVLSRAQLMSLLRGRDGVMEERAIDLLVSRLRRKLAHGGRQLELIRTVRGDGYEFDPRPEIGGGTRP